MRAAGGRGVYQDQRVGLGGGGKPALSSLPSWTLSALEANLFPSDLWAKRQQQAWESFRESRGGRLHERTCLCVGCTLQPPQHCLSPGRGSLAPLSMAADLTEFLHSQDNILGFVCTVMNIRVNKAILGKSLEPPALKKWTEILGLADLNPLSLPLGCPSPPCSVLVRLVLLQPTQGPKLQNWPLLPWVS